MDDPYPVVPTGKFVADRTAAVGGAVVDQKNLQILIALGRQTVQTGAQIDSRIVHGYDHGNQRTHGFTVGPSLPRQPSRMPLNSILTTAALSHSMDRTALSLT